MNKPQAGRRLLIVDDHDGVRGAIRDWLCATYGEVQVREARDAEEVLRDVDLTEVDIVLMDIGLPGISGIEATRLLRARAPEVVFLVVSVYDSDAQRAAALAAGARMFIPKRRMHEGLRAALDGLLGASAGPKRCGVRLA